MTNTPSTACIERDVAPFKVRGLAIPYPEFVPRLYNLCLSLGFKRHFVMPSRAFCSDENQGFPIILLSKHFGVFPFDHGRVGGIMAVDRHGPHAHHGEDSLILQASHVGYDPTTGLYGTYKRPLLERNVISPSCGKITLVIEPYLRQYQFAQQRIFLRRSEKGQYLIKARDSLIDFSSKPITDGLVLRLDRIVKADENNRIVPAATHTTSHSYEVSEHFRNRLYAAGYQWQEGSGEPIGNHLAADLFSFREELHGTDESIHLERNLIEFMPQIVTHKSPQLKAAQINIQMEFARTVESIRQGGAYEGKNLIYLAGLNIDISAFDGNPETTYFVPWAAHIQLREKARQEFLHPLEQDELFAMLMAQSKENVDMADIKEQIGRMLNSPLHDIRTPQ
ncbi:hypothetical protein [Desulfofustis glycolicus]|uniref:Limiting CO2-inducible protein B/C beta carbonyic anhydrase domain-containing protein n=1 Tax=Desulfofustis glycolicus DSM 9705 TaxID=1121409 RepID=A0A1M5TJA3_9BACT|nr:hypothetical protein [Desulfofustis glycolicus]MCB2216445.1 hypothetical protein [Desulfobulbaceae bacterium]SHH50885.1 hypothetical protein SAMN02745124_00755 [Desulfofustis glycolicus DSM 9705]